MSKIIGAQIIGNNVYIIKKRGLLDSIFSGFSSRQQTRHSINIEKPEFNPIRIRCHSHRSHHCSPKR